MCEIIHFTYEVSLSDLYAYLIKESLTRQNRLSIFRIFAIPNKTISIMRKIRNCMKKKLTFVGEKKTNFKLGERKTFNMMFCNFDCLGLDILVNFTIF